MQIPRPTALRKLQFLQHEHERRPSDPSRLALEEIRVRLAQRGEETNRSFTVADPLDSGSTPAVPFCDWFDALSFGELRLFWGRLVRTLEKRYAESSTGSIEPEAVAELVTRVARGFVPDQFPKPESKLPGIELEEIRQLPSLDRFE